MGAALHLATRCSFSTRWRGVVSLLIAFAVLLSSLQHLSCLTEDGVPLSGATASIVGQSGLQSGGSEPAVLTHCHCICHVSARTLAGLVSIPIEFAHPTYALGEDHMPHALAAALPFKPPRA
jgi:hypothetical protein